MECGKNKEEISHDEGIKQLDKSITKGDVEVSREIEIKFDFEDRNVLHDIHSEVAIRLLDDKGIQRRPSIDSLCNYKHPIDHGWAWMIALGGFMANVFFAGIVRSTGMLYVEYCDLYKVSKTEGSWIISAQYIAFYFSSPLSSLIGARFSGRVTAFLAGTFSTVGLLISSFAPSIKLIYFSHGVLLGLTLSFLCSPIIATVGLYFRKRSSLAIGITLMGASVGSFAIPPLVQLIMNEFGFRNMLMIMSAIFAHIFIIGALLRPISVYDTDRESPLVCQRDKEIEFTISIQSLNFGRSDLVEAPKMKPNSSAAEVFHRLCPQWNLELLRERKLYIFIVAFALAHLGLILSFFVIPPHAADLGLSDGERTTILFVMGFPDLVCRISIGYIADNPKVPKVFLFSGIVIFQALVWLVVTFVGNFAGMVAFGLMVSGLGGCIWTLIPIIFKSTLGTKNMGTAMGFTLLFAGVVFLAIPPLLGFIRDTDGSWIWSYRFVAIMLALSGVLVLLEPLLQRFERRKRANKESK